MGVPQRSVIAPLLFNIMVHDVDTAVKGKVVLTMYAGDMDGHPHQTSPHKQLVGETKHEIVPGSCGRGGPLYASKWIRSLFPENGVRPIPHQHLSEHGGAHQGERAEHLCIERSQVPGCTLHSLGAYEPAGRAQRAERLPSPQRDKGAICSALDEHPQDPSERGMALVRSRLSYGLEAMPHLSKTGLARLTAIEVRGLRLALGRPQSVPQCLVQRGRAPPVPPPHPARL